MKIRIFRIVAVLLLVIWMSVIFALSAQNATESASLSGGLKYKLFSVFYPDFNQMTEVEQQEALSNFPIRKIAHFSAYFILGILTFNAIVTHRKIPLKLRCLFSFAFCVLYSISDEVHQYFVPGRGCELRDILIDSYGALLAIGMLTLFCRFLKKMYPVIKTEEC